MPLKKAIFLGLAGLALVGCTLVGVLGVRVALFVHRVAPAAGLTDIINIVHPDTPTVYARNDPLGRLNFLLLGYGGPEHDGAYLTDSMMVVSAQTDTRQLAMIAIPRDLWTPIPTSRDGTTWTTKINGSYTIGILDADFPNKESRFRGPLGGGNLSAEMVHRVTGLPIPYWVAVDFAGFVRVVDAVGGIDVEVPRALDDWEYPDDTNGYLHVHFNAGAQHMDGARALQFARLRHTAGGDFDRSRRQQLIMLAVRRKAFSLGGLPKLLALMDAVQDHFRTNMTLPEIRKFADVVNGLNDVQPVRVSIDDTNFVYGAVSADAQSILLPYDPGYAGLHRYLDKLFMDPVIPNEAATVRFLNGTDGYGLKGRTMADLLSELWTWAGLATLPPGEVAHTYRHSEVHDYSGGKAAVTVAFLAAFFDATVVEESGATPGGAVVTVIIGRDFASAFAPIPPPPAQPAPTAAAAPKPSPTPGPILSIPPVAPPPQPR